MPLFSNGICICFVGKAYQKWYLLNKFRAVILIKFYRFDIRCTTQFIHKNYRLVCYQSRTTNKKWMWNSIRIQSTRYRLVFFLNPFMSESIHTVGNCIESKQFLYNYVFMIINAIEQVSNFFPNHSYSLYNSQSFIFSIQYVEWNSYLLENCREFKGENQFVSCSWNWSQFSVQWY